MQQVGLSLLLKKKQLNQTEKEFLVRDFFENTSFKKVKARQRKIKVYQFRTSTEATLSKVVAHGLPWNTLKSVLAW